MSYSINQYTGNGSNKNFSVTFQYISQAHVEVRVNSVLKTLGVDYSWLNASTIQLNTAPAAGIVVDIRRITPRDDQIVQFQDASVLTASDLNTNGDQGFNIVQEVLDAVDNSVALATDGTFDAKGHRVSNVADPVNSTDAVNLQYLQAHTEAGAVTTAQAAAASATASASDAATSATNAATSASSAAASLAAMPSAGTGANQVLQIGSDGKLPAIDGSKLTNVGRGGSETINLSSVDVQLTSTSKQIIFVNATTPGLNIILPDATSLTPRKDTFHIYTVGTCDFNIKTFGGAMIQANVLGYGSSVQYNLTDNSTSAGLWATSSGPVDLILESTPASTITASFVYGFTMLTATTGIITYVDLATSNLKAVAFTLSGQTPTFGTPVTVDSTASAGYVAMTNSSGFITVNSTTAVLAYCVVTTVYAKKIVAMTVSGTTITLGTATQLSSVAYTSNYTMSMCILNTNKIGIAWSQSNNSTNVSERYFRAVTVSGTTLTSGADVGLSNGGSSSGAFTGGCVALGTDKAFVTHWNAAASGYEARVVTASGTVCTAQTATAISNGPSFNLIAVNASTVFHGSYKYTISGNTVTEASQLSSAFVTADVALVGTKYVGKYSAGASRRFMLGTNAQYWSPFAVSYSVSGSGAWIEAVDSTYAAVAYADSVTNYVTLGFMKVIQ